MALKIHLLAFLSFAITATSIAEAQQLSFIRVSINGTVPCALSSSGTPPPFPNATVVFQCPPLNVIRANTTTSSTGSFNLSLSVTPLNISTLINCRVVVTTPLNRCNATLPGIGILVSNGSIIVGTNVTNRVITLFLRVLGFTYQRRAIGN